MGLLSDTTHWLSLRFSLVNTLDHYMKELSRFWGMKSCAEVDTDRERGTFKGDIP